MIKLVMSIELWCDFILEKKQTLVLLHFTMLEITRFQNILKASYTEIKTFLGHNSLVFGLFHVSKNNNYVLVCSSASMQPDNIC